MDIPTFFPNLKQGATKDLIIKILSLEKSLTNQQIYLRLKKEFAKSISYQSTRQALVELMEAGVLTKEKRDYSISRQWILSLEQYSKFLKKKFIEKKEIKVIDHKTKEISLHSLNEMAYFMLYSFKDHFFDMNKDNDLYLVIRHLWFPFVHKKNRDSLREFFAKTKNHIYTTRKSFLDIVLERFYRSFGKVKLGIKLNDDFETLIQGDCVAKIHMPSELKDRLDKLYKAKGLLSFRVIDEFTELIYAEYSIKIIIIRDKKIAEDLKQELQKL